MINQHQVHFCFAEITKAAAMPGALARAGIGAAAGAIADGGPAAMHAMRAHEDVARLRASGALSSEQEKAFTARQKLHAGSHALRGALLGAAGGVALPHAAAAAKKYSGEAAAHLGREFGRGAAEHAVPAARAVMYEVHRAAPAVGRAVAGGAAGVAGAVGENAARGAVKGVKGALTPPPWVGRLKEHAMRFIQEE